MANLTLCKDEMKTCLLSPTMTWNDPMAMISGRVFTKFTTKQPGVACEHQETITLVEDNGAVNRRSGMGFV